MKNLVFWDIMTVMRHFKIRDKILCMTISLIILLCVLIDAFVQNIISGTMENSIYKTINGVCNETAYLIEQKYSADFHLENGKLFAGRAILSDDFEFLDSLKKYFDSEISVFYGNTRYLTTIQDKNGDRLIGTVQDDGKIISAVFAGGTYQEKDVMINGEKYYGVYKPLTHVSGSVCGMVFAGISKKSVISAERSLLFTILLISVSICAVIIAVISIFTNRLCRDLNHIKNFLDKLSKNEMEIQMNKKVLARNDEIGELGVHSVEISRNIIELMNKDPLTHLFNRRSGGRMLESMFRRTIKDAKPLTLVMCDIDFFKNVNDTYGHSAGDDVLVQISQIISRNCPESGFAVRWGGEEFLLALHADTDGAVQTLENIRRGLSELQFHSEDKGKTFRMTMTFGVATADPGEDWQSVIRRADEKLYVGKTSGRNKIVAK